MTACSVIIVILKGFLFPTTIHKECNRQTVKRQTYHQLEITEIVQTSAEDCILFFAASKNRSRK